MMELKRLSADCPLFERAMTLYRMSFPYHEQREPEAQKRILSDPAYHFNCVFDGETWVGLLLTWETDDFVYVEHFCILPQLRGAGYGSRALELLAACGLDGQSLFETVMEETAREE